MSTPKKQEAISASRRDPLPHAQTNLPTARKLLYATLATLLFLGLLLGTGEGLLRLLGVGYETAFFVPADSGHVTSNPRFAWRYFGKSLQPRTTNLVHMPSKKPPGAYRIFVLGGSAAMGVPSPDFSFSRFLEAMLQRAYPEQEFEVVNTALTAINSHVVRDIAAECADYEPDMFILYLGNNEVVGPFGPASVFEGLADNLGVIRASLWLKSTRLGQSIVELTRAPPQITDWEGMRMFLQNRISAEDPRLARVYRQFAANITAICQAAERVQAQVLLCTVATNLKDSPPFASQGAGDSERTDAASAVAPQAGERKFTEQIIVGEGDQRMAFDATWIAPLQERIAAQPKNALLHFLLGRCYLNAGEPGLAAESLAQARDLDLLRFRADTEINRTIRQVARREADHGVQLVDVEQAMAEKSLDNILGRKHFLEHVHFNLEGQYQLARTVFDAVVRQLPPEIQPAARPRPEAASFAACARRLALTDLEKRGVLKAALRLVDKPPFLGQLGHDQRCAEWRAEVKRLEEVLAADNGALEQAYREATEQAPKDLVLHLLAGRFFLASDQTARALGHFRTIEAALPENHLSYLLLGRALLAQGQYRESHTSFKKASELAIDRADVLSDTANIYSEHGELSRALVLARQAHALRPDRASTMKLLARLQLQTQQGAAAYPLLRKLHQRRPKDLEVLEQLTLLSLQQGDNRGAAQYAKQYLSLRPEEPRLRQFYAMALRNLGKLPESAEQYEMILKQVAANKNVLKQYVQVLRALDRDADALAYCQQRIAAEGERAMLLEQLALLRATSRDAAVHDPEQALEWARKLNHLSATPNVQALNTLAIAQAESGDFASAADTVQKALARARQVGNARAIGVLTRQLRLIEQGRKPSEALP